MGFTSVLTKSNNLLMSKDKICVEIAQAYWMIHAIVIFRMGFYGMLLPIISVCIVINYILKWIVLNHKYVKTYSILMIVYSVIYAILNGVLLVFFKQSTTMYLGMLLIVVLNFIISVTTFMKYRKWYSFNRKE